MGHSDEDNNAGRVCPLASPIAKGVDEYDTNIYEERVNEGDHEYVFVGYGNYLIVWEVVTSGCITNMTLSPIKNAYVQSPSELPQLGGFGWSRKHHFMSRFNICP